MTLEEFYDKPEHERLRILRDWVQQGCPKSGLFVKYHGICSNANLTSATYELFSNWEHFSGDMLFPVEGIHFLHNEQYNKYNTNNRWGKRRLQLLDYLIESTKS